MPLDDKSYYGQASVTSSQGEWNKLRFAIQRQLEEMTTSLPVRVIAVRPGALGPTGQVDIQILVQQISGNGETVDHGTIPNVPYVRLQGGANSVIIDPEVGDIGLACFCSRDISSVKSARALAPPGSRRAYDFSDAVYLGGMLNTTPTQYIQFKADGILIHSPHAVTITAPTITATATTSATVSAPTVSVTASGSASVTAPSISMGASGQTLRAFVDSRMTALFNGHTHTSAAPGSPTSNPLQTMGAGELTSTVTGG